MSFIHFMSLKLIKTTQKCLIFWNVLCVFFLHKAHLENSKVIILSPYFLEISQTPKTVCYF